MNLILLLDLDDTLLNTNLAAFVPAYFQALAQELAPRLPSELVLRALLAGTNLMNENVDASRTLEEVFASVFYPAVGIPRGELDAAVENFYDKVFPTLAGLTSQVPEAKPFVDWALSQGWRVAIATDPLLPRKAGDHRLRWAGFDPAQFELISSYEQFHFSKTHPAYYAEVLGRLGCPEGPVLMVGNDVERDITPAQRLGLATFHINEDAAPSPATQKDPHGDLKDLRAFLASVDPASLTPSFHSMDSVLAILSSTPGVLLGLTQDLEPSAWSEPGIGDWSFTELFCHLRDTEIEIHPMQIRAFRTQNEPFISRPDSSVWASQRDYLREDGRLALDQFASARRETMTLLQQSAPAEWSQRARHAIFGPTNFLEVVGFMAAHDRLHIQQAWNILKKQGR